LQKVAERSVDRGELGRGASTITQQLVKNLFLTTWRSPIRKGIEATLVPMTEVILGKQRILELYLNVIEWGKGIYGAEEAAKFHYKTQAARLSREQSARLAAIIPNPRTRRPERMNEYSSEIQIRMRQMGW
jgi:monofunctional biosynthetic peptidoglycan transglycosylase